MNERTTVATASAFAQFVAGTAILGNPIGMANAVPMAGNLADVQTGGVAAVLANPPIPGTVLGRTVLSHPLGLAADSKGNVWAANSDWVSAPCPEQGTRGSAANPSVSLFMADTHQPYPAAPFTGGGLTLPWGVAVDGNDTVWVFNFGAAPIGTLLPPPTGIGRLPDRHFVTGTVCAPEPGRNAPPG